MDLITKLQELGKEIPQEEWEEFDRIINRKCQWSIGDKVQDEDGNVGYVGIYWNDGDFCTIENDAAHPNPKLITSS